MTLLPTSFACDTKLAMEQCILKMLERHNAQHQTKAPALQQCHDVLSELAAGVVLLRR